MKKLGLLLFSLITATNVWAQAAADKASDNEVLIIVLCSAFVLLMQFGFAFLESGISRTKNTVNIMMKNFVDLGVTAFIFFAVGYAFMFGDSMLGLVGTSYFFLDGVENYEVVLYQIMFAATAVTITSGAMAERTKFFAYIVSAVLITALIYPIVGSWVWSAEGWLASRDFIDLAGGSVVHSVGAWVALAGIIVLGARTGRFDKEGNVQDIPGHNLSYVAFGGIILWIGWFAFNTGSAIGLDLDLGKIALNTHLGAAGGLLGIVFTQLLLRKPILIVTTVNGALGGLVSITAAAHIITPSFAFMIGFIGGFVTYMGERFLLKLKLDDVISAIPVHGFCGVWGTMAAGIFYTGDMFNVSRILTQFYGVVAVFMWSFIIALLVYLFISIFIGLRVDKTSERRGLDFSEHYEIAYPEFVDVITHRGKT